MRPQSSVNLCQPLVKGRGAKKQKPMEDSGLAYLKTVRDAFRDERGKYDQFMKLMKSFSAERFNVVRGIEEVKELLKGHKDLILGFNFFLPKGYEIKLPLEDEHLQQKTDALIEANKLLCRIETRFQDHVYKSFLAIEDAQRQKEDYHHSLEGDILDELSHLSQNTSRTDPIHFAHAQKFLFHERSSAVPTEQQRCVPKRKKTKTSHDDHNQCVDHRLKRDWSKWEKENRDYYHNGILKLLSMKWGNSCIAEDPRAEPFRNVDKVFDMHPVPSPCYDRSSMKSIYSKEIITEQKLQSSATGFLGKYPDLMKGFNECVNQCEKNDAHHNHDDRVKETSECRGRLKSTAVSNKNVSGPKLSQYASKKYSEKPVEELDLSSCEQCTPSYHLLPKFQIPSSSQRTKLEAEVLNDCWKCANTSITDYSSKHVRNNLYEKVLFKCEDDRFELDVLLEIAKSTAHQVEELMEKIDNNIIERDNPIDTEKHLTAQNLRCIEKIYGNHGLDVLCDVKKNAPTVLRVILTSLKQKQKEWERCRSNFNKLWAQVYAENYHKSF